jgi:hypothetical protein
MHNDKKMLIGALTILLIPLSLAFCGGDRFRYPCQDPKNWNEDMCKPPICDVTRTCPEQIFKGQRDPRLGPPPDPANLPVSKVGGPCGK